MQPFSIGSITHLQICRDTHTSTLTLHTLVPNTITIYISTHKHCMSLLDYMDSTWQTFFQPKKKKIPNNVSATRPLNGLFCHMSPTPCIVCIGLLFRRSRCFIQLYERCSCMVVVNPEAYQGIVINMILTSLSSSIIPETVNGY